MSYFVLFVGVHFSGWCFKGSQEKARCAPMFWAVADSYGCSSGLGACAAAHAAAAGADICLPADALPTDALPVGALPALAPAECLERSAAAETFHHESWQEGESLWFSSEILGICPLRHTQDLFEEALRVLPGKNIRGSSLEARKGRGVPFFEATLFWAVLQEATIDTPYFGGHIPRLQELGETRRSSNPFWFSNPLYRHKWDCAMSFFFFLFLNLFFFPRLVEGFTSYHFHPVSSRFLFGRLLARAHRSTQDIRAVANVAPAARLCR